jgi:hypothetical protein
VDVVYLAGVERFAPGLFMVSRRDPFYRCAMRQYPRDFSNDPAYTAKQSDLPSSHGRYAREIRRIGGFMCYNCGCQMPNNDMGKADNITNETFQKASAAMDMTVKESRQNALELLEKVLASKEVSSDKNWKPE